MVGSMLQLARLDQGEVLSPRPVQLADLCRAQVDLARRRAGGRVEVCLRVEGGSQTVLIGQEAIEEALANLLDNAVRHAKGRVEVSMSTVGREVDIAVIDDGPGLAAGDEGKAFERFVSLDGLGGVGMGLPIARALVEGEGGHLEYVRGRFLLRLPMDRRLDVRS
jgi:signal transduction histidine kinase